MCAARSPSPVAFLLNRKASCLNNRTSHVRLQVVMAMRPHAANPLTGFCTVVDVAIAVSIAHGSTAQDRFEANGAKGCNDVVD